VFVAICVFNFMVATCSYIYEYMYLARQGGKVIRIFE